MKWLGLATGLVPGIFLHSPHLPAWIVLAPLEDSCHFQLQYQWGWFWSLWLARTPGTVILVNSWVASARAGRVLRTYSVLEEYNTPDLPALSLTPHKMGTSNCLVWGLDRGETESQSSIMWHPNLHDDRFYCSVKWGKASLRLPVSLFWNYITPVRNIQRFQMNPQRSCIILQALNRDLHSSYCGGPWVFAHSLASPSLRDVCFFYLFRFWLYYSAVLWRWTSSGSNSMFWISQIFP